LIKIIPANEEDMLRISEIEQESNSPPWTHSSLLNELYKDDSYFIVAVNYDLPSDLSPTHISGYAIMRQLDTGGELLKIAVDETERRNGIGDLLLNSCLEYAVKNSMDSVLLEVRKGNTPAVGLYQKHGFKHVRTRANYYTAPVEAAWIMIKQLNIRNEE